MMSHNTERNEPEQFTPILNTVRGNINVITYYGGSTENNMEIDTELSVPRVTPASAPDQYISSFILK